MNELPKTKTGLSRIISAFRYSLQGFRATFKTEEAFRQEVYAGCVLMPLSFFIASTVVEWILLVLTYTLVLLAEIINTAIEAVVDRLGSDYHELSGKAKDAGSAVVFLAILIAIVTWGAILAF